MILSSSMMTRIRDKSLEFLSALPLVEVLCILNTHRFVCFVQCQFEVFVSFLVFVAQ